MTREKGGDRVKGEIPFGPIFVGLVNQAESELTRATEAGGLRFRTTALASARRHLMLSMAGVSGLAFWDEIRGHPGGFPAFFQRIQANGLNTTLASYPGLETLLQTLRSQWVAHLVAISKSGATKLRDSSPGAVEIQDLRLGLSDRHEGGRTVTRVDLSDGRQFAYKPRNLAAQILFTGVLSWLQGRRSALPRGYPKTINGGPDGWMEWIAPEDCTDLEEVEDFFRLAGAQLLVLHVLGAVDCHAENAIARGPVPVLIDVETLGHPSSELSIDEGVLRTGYLPYWKKIGGRWFAMGGLGAPGSQVSPWDIGSWTHVNRVGMALDYVPMHRPQTNNLPSLAGEECPAYDFVDELISGFQEAGEALLEGRANLMSSVGPLRAVASTRVRFLARPTQLYGELLASVVQPSALRNPEHLHRTLTTRLHEAPAPLAMRSESLLPQLIRLEVDALLRMDIPRFEFDLGSTTLQSMDGNIPSFARETGADRILGTIEHLTRERLDEQCGLIRAALAVDQLADNAVPDSSSPEAPARLPGTARQRRYYPFMPPMRG